MFGKTHYREGGTRGGADRFNWEDVKADKYRECYLGHSLKATVGRWAKGKDLQWYAKSGKSEQQLVADEIAAVKQAEEDAMAQALGFAPKQHRVTATLDKADLKKLLERGTTREEVDAERVEGLGAAPARAHEVPGQSHAMRLSATEAGDLLPATDPSYPVSGSTDSFPVPSAVQADTHASPPVPAASAGAKDRGRKKHKKEKKEKKEKRRHKHKHRHRHHRSRSSSRERSDRSTQRRVRREGSHTPPARSQRERRKESDRSHTHKRYERSRSGGRRSRSR